MDISTGPGNHRAQSGVMIQTMALTTTKTGQQWASCQQIKRLNNASPNKKDQALRPYGAAYFGIMGMRR